MDWTRSEVLELINHFRQNECLWDNDCEDYNNTDLKKNAWVEIANLLNKDVEEVKRKVRYLRTAYVAEKKKVDNTKEQGGSYQPNLFYYRDLNFLDPVVVMRKSSLPASGATSYVRRSSSDKTKRKLFSQHDRKSFRDRKLTNAIESIMASISEPVAGENENDNIFTSFGKTTSLQLQQLPFDMAIEAMSIIQNLISRKTLACMKNSSNTNRSSENMSL